MVVTASQKKDSLSLENMKIETIRRSDSTGTKILYDRTDKDTPFRSRYAQPKNVPDLVKASVNSAAKTPGVPTATPATEVASAVSNPKVPVIKPSPEDSARYQSSAKDAELAAAR